MGLLKHLLFWPVTGPAFLTRFSLAQVRDTVQGELTDDERIKSELLELQLLLEMGDIDDDQYLAREADLMRQLREVREWREEFGMSTSGGPVRVAQPDEESESGDVRAADPRSANVRLTFDDPSA